MTPTLWAGALVLTAGAAARKDPPRPDPLVGEWACVSRTFDGRPDDPAGYRYVFAAGGRWAVYRGGRPVNRRSR